MKRGIEFLVVVFGVLTLSACAGISKSTKPKAQMTQSILEQDQGGRDMVVRDPALKAGLWRDASARNFFKDLRAHKVGDLVTVNIVETARAIKKAGTQTSRESSIDGGIDNVLGWENKIKHLTSFGRNKVRNAYDNNPMFKGSLKNNFSGSGSTSRDDSMTASITVRVMEVKPNGNLFIKGTREVKVNNETQYIILSGLIRPADISPDNTVLSSYIGDARIEYMGSGPVSDKQRPGWLARAVDFVWPF
ncbi:MAG: flagellar basal body L-ring protein FlgH [Deltaproteobacteria bacterium]|nr:flagellar basal body L-ring protein FlgH [Deltaproteobacteria bacterium]